MKEKIVYALIILLASVLLNQGIDRFQAYLHNRQYDTRLHQQAYEKEMREQVSVMKGGD